MVYVWKETRILSSGRVRNEDFIEPGKVTINASFAVFVNYLCVRKSILSVLKPNINNIVNNTSNVISAE